MSNNHSKLNRRNFTAAVGVSVISSGVFVNPMPAQDSTSPNERLNLAAIGVTGRAAGNIKGCATQNLVAMVDIDSKLLETGTQAFPNARKYTDFRVMLEKEAEKIDAVIVSTPDHTHAPAAAMALRLKKHVYCEKPLTHTVHEARTLANIAKENKLKTQMGTQIHALGNYRRVVELVQSGTIGKIQRAHVWAGAVYTGAKFVKAEKPEHVDWDLWLGPAPQRDYCADIHPFNWRKFWDYGRGSLGDFGCHYMDLAHWALDLRNPVRVKAQGPEVDPVSTPAWCIVDYQYPARGKKPAVHLTWYDSGRKPKEIQGLKDLAGNTIAPWGGGQLFIGTKGMILSDYSRHIVLSPEGQQIEYKVPDPWIPDSIGHHNEWLQAIKEDGETTCNFDYSGALTESVLLGTVAYQSGEHLQWNSKKLQVTNSRRAQQLIHKQYRKGWEL